jgi:hypothetical protein
VRRRLAVKMRVWVAAALSAMLVAGCGSSAAERPPAPTTAEGQRLMEFEALLVRTFHTTRVSASRGPNFDCAGDCSPLSRYQLYRFTSRHPVGSAYKLGPRRLGNVTFGNYPSPVRVKGRYVVCAPGKYLTLNAAAVSFSFDCLRPERP